MRLRLKDATMVVGLALALGGSTLLVKASKGFSSLVSTPPW